jgi:hypothetical protein
MGKPLQLYYVSDVAASFLAPCAKNQLLFSFARTIMSITGRKSFPAKKACLFMF